VIAIILLAVVAIVLFGAGFALHLLWWVAIAALVVWLLGFLIRPGGQRWYYW